MSENKISQRDAFWGQIYELAKIDREIVVLSADMGAPALDKFRRDLPNQYIGLGIAEQNAILIASGLSLAGKKAYVYAISSFISLNTIEKIKVQNCVMGIPITIVGVGAGLGYPDSGPTHHALEDFAVMRALTGIDIYNVTDSAMATDLAHETANSKRTSYLRLERQTLPNLYQEKVDFQRGFRLLGKGDEDQFIISTGVMTHMALDLAKKLSGQGPSVGVIDLFKFPFEERSFIDTLSGAKQVATLEEGFLPGGMGSAVCEVLCDHGVQVPVKRFGLDHRKGHCFEYGGRASLQKYFGLDFEVISIELARLFQ